MDQESLRTYKNKDNHKVPDRVSLPLGTNVIPGEEYILFLYWRHPEDPFSYSLVARTGAVISKADTDKWSEALKLLS